MSDLGKIEKMFSDLDKKEMVRTSRDDLRKIIRFSICKAANSEKSVALEIVKRLDALSTSVSEHCEDILKSDDMVDGFDIEKDLFDALEEDSKDIVPMRSISEDLVIIKSLLSPEQDLVAEKKEESKPVEKSVDSHRWHVNRDINTKNDDDISFE